MPITSEVGREFTWSNFDDEDYTPGGTMTEDFLVFPGSVGIRAGLSRVAALEAVIGIAGFTSRESGDVTFNSHADWHSAVYGNIGAFTVGLHVVRGTLRGWLYVQAWS